MIENLTILAPGLLGASIAMAAKQRSAAKTIRIWARRQASVDQLTSKPWCDFASTELESTCSEADLLIICAPVERIIELSHKIAPFLKASCIVTDVGSTKSDIVTQCSNILAGKAHFIGSHPMAGSEKTGMENGQADLFDQRTCFITPTTETEKATVDSVSQFWKTLGSSVIIESPERHDALTARGSHSPHIIAAALSSYLHAACPEASTFCGNGLKDTTRIASGDPNLWTEIIFQNRSEILKSLAQFQDELNRYQEAIQDNDKDTTKQFLARGKEFRDSL